MKGTLFLKPVELNIQTSDESWQQGSLVKGTLQIKNHSSESIQLIDAGVGLAYAEIKKVHAKTQGVLKPEPKTLIGPDQLAPGETKEITFELKLPENCPVSDKKSSYFLTYGQRCLDGHLQLNVRPKVLFEKLIGLMDTFYRFKLKEYKAVKSGVEYKLLPPTSRELASLESLLLSMSTDGENLNLNFDFQVKKLDTSGITNSIKKETTKITRTLGPKEYSLGRDMINQDVLLKVFEEVISKVKNSTF